MLFYAIVIGGATFVEKYYGTIVAVDVIYRSWWFELLNIWLGILLLTCLIQGIKTKKARFGMQLFHCAFLVALIGAAITRYYGFEGRITLQNGETSNVVLSRDKFLNVFISKDIDHISPEALQTLDSESMQGIAQSFAMPLTPYKKTSISYNMQAYDKTLSIRSIEVRNRSHELSDNLYEAVLEVSYGNEVRYYNLLNNGQILGAPFGNHLVILSWQSKKVLLPFRIQLQKFTLDMYPGSENPSSYSSLVSVIDDELQTNMPYEIYMNHVLDYRGYRFFQENYTTEVITLDDGTTKEEHNGTILSVNKDPGKIPTYIAYTMMIIGGIWLLIDSNGRFAKLGQKLRDMRTLNLAILLGIAFTTTNLAMNPSMNPNPQRFTPSMIDTNKIHTDTTRVES